MALAYRFLKRSVSWTRHLRRTVYQTCKNRENPGFIYAVVSVLLIGSWVRNRQ